MTDAASIDALVVEASRGCDEALTALYREFHGSLVGFLFGLVSDEAEDLAAETWIDVAAALPRFRGDGMEFRRLLFTVARRRAIDHGRKRLRRRTEPMDVGTLRLIDDASDPAETVIDVDGSAQAIRRISELLPRSQAEVVLLRVVAGLSVPEVAQIVGRSSNAVSVLQSRALTRLAKSPPAATGSGNGSAVRKDGKDARILRLERLDG